MPKETHLEHTEKVLVSPLSCNLRVSMYKVLGMQHNQIPQPGSWARAVEAKMFFLEKGQVPGPGPCLAHTSQDPCQEPVG